MKFQWKKLYAAIDSLRTQSGGESWRSLAVRQNVTPSLFTRISQDKPTSVRNLLLLLDIVKPLGVKDFVELKDLKGKKS